MTRYLVIKNISRFSVVNHFLISSHHLAKYNDSVKVCLCVAVFTFRLTSLGV